MSADDSIGFAQRPQRSQVIAWLFAAAPGAAFLTLLSVRYALTTIACTSAAARIALELSAALTLIALAIVGVSARRGLRSAGAEPLEHSTSERFLLYLAMMLSAFFAVLVCAIWLPSLFIDACSHSSG